MSAFAIERTQPTTYLDERGVAVRGYVIYVRLLEYNELHEVRLPTLQADVVNDAVKRLVEQRDKLTQLGS